MLQIIREKVTGWVAVTIVTLLIIPFAFWGVNSYFDGTSRVLAGSVNGTDIGLQEYQRAYQRVRQQFQASQDGAILTSDQEELLKQRTIDGLIEQKLQQQNNDSAGLHIGDRLLGSTIKDMSYFQGLDGFDQAIYESAVSQTGLSMSAFEEQMRQDLVSQQMQYSLLDSVFLTNKEKEHMTRLINQTRDISYTIISSQAFIEMAVISDAEIQEYYRTNTQQFYDPEQVKIAYVDLSLKDIAAGVSVGEQELRDYFDTNRANYEIEEQRSIRQLFIETGEDAEEAIFLEARDVAKALHESIENGLSFDEAVEKVREGTELNFETSEHGFLTRGIMEAEVDEVMFAMNESDISDPIETVSGMYIIELTKITGGKSTSFEDIKDQLEEDLRLDKAEGQYVELADRLTNLAFENPDTLEFVTEDLGLPVKQSNYFSRNPNATNLLQMAAEELQQMIEYEQITSNSDVISNSFSDDILINGNNSEPIEIEENRLVVLRVEDHLAEKLKSLEEVREQINNKLKFEHALERTREKGEKITADLRNNVTKDSLSNEYGFEWQEATYVKRNDTDINRTLLQTAFSAGRPEEGKLVVAGTSLASADYAIVIVNGVSETGSDALNEATQQAVNTQLQQMRIRSTWTSYLQGLKDNADIEVFTNNL